MFRAVGGSVSLRWNGARPSGRARWHLPTGFVVRINEIADAAARKAAALENLRRRGAGPVVGAAVRAARGRPASCDRAGAGRDLPTYGRGSMRQSMGSAVRSAEHSVPAEQSALEEVQLVLHEIVDALLDQAGRQWPVPIEAGSEVDEEVAGRRGAVTRWIARCFVSCCFARWTSSPPPPRVGCWRPRLRCA